MTWAVAWQMITGLFGFMWKYRLPIAIFAACALVFGLWQRTTTLQADAVKLKAHITQQELVISEYEKAQQELDGKVAYEKDKAKISAASAAAVAAGRKDGDAPMAPVLRAEYERVRGLAAARAGQNP